MRSAALALVSAASAIMVEAQANVQYASLDFGPLLKAWPDLTKAKPAPTKVVDRQASASSVLSVMSARKPKTTSIRTTTAKAAKKTSAKAIKTTSTKKSSKKTTIKTTTKPKSSSTRLLKARAVTTVARDATVSACAAQSIPYGYTPNPNTPASFLTDTTLASFSVNGPLGLAGYTQNFQNQFGSVSAAGYLGYYQLPTWSPASCGKICDQTDGCTFFNIYFERSPAQDPTAGQCPNPAAGTGVICTLYSASASAATTTNIGQWRTDFLMVVAGSNGYTKNPTPKILPGFNRPTALPGFALVSTVNGVKIQLGSNFVSGAYDPSVCVATCQSWTTTNKQDAANKGQTSFGACNYINAAAFSAPTSSGGVATGTWCSYYTLTDASQYATATNASIRGGPVGQFTNSYGYAMTTPDGTLPDPLNCSNWTAPSFIDSSNRNYSTQCGYLVEGSTDEISSQGLLSWAACINKCSTTANCSAVAYYQPWGGCSLRNLSSNAKPTLSAGAGWGVSYLPASLKVPWTYV